MPYILEDDAEAPGFVLENDPTYAFRRTQPYTQEELLLLSRMKPSERAMRPQRSGIGYGAGREALAGATMGLSLPAEAALTDATLDELRAAQSGYREENPNMALAANIAGALPTGGLIGRGLLSLGGAALGRIPGASMIAGITPSIAGAAAKAGALGATQGGITSAAEGKNVLAGGALSGALGAAGTPVASAVGALGRVGRRALTGAAPLNAAEARIGTALREAGVNERSIPAVGEALSEMGGNLVGSTYDGPVQRLSGAVYRRSPAAAISVPGELGARKTARREELPQVISRALGASPSISGLTSASRGRARSLYDMAFEYGAAPSVATRIVPDQTMLAVLNEPEGATAFAQAVTNARARAINAGTPMAGIPQSIEELMEGGASVQFLDDVKRQLQDVFSRARQPGSSGAVASKEAEEALSSAYTRSLRGIAPPTYGEALDEASIYKQAEEGFDLGRSMFGKKADDVRAAMTELRPGQESAFRSGLARAAQEAADAAKDNAEVLGRTIGSPQLRDALQAAGADRAMLDRANRASLQQMAFEYGLLGNSQTAARNVQDDLLGESLSSMTRFATSPKTAILDAIRMARLSGKSDEMADILFNFRNEPKKLADLQRVLNQERLLQEARRSTATQSGSGARSFVSQQNE